MGSLYGGFGSYSSTSTHLFADFCQFTQLQDRNFYYNSVAEDQTPQSFTLLRPQTSQTCLHKTTSGNWHISNKFQS